MTGKRIKKIIFGILLCLAFNVTYEFNNATEVYADTVVVNATNVNLRSKPTTNSKSYGKLSKGTTLNRTEERSDGWSSVDYSGTTAYIKTEFVVPAAAAAASAASTNIEKAAPKASTDYIANTNTQKFHYPSCSSVAKMKEKNKWYFSGTRDELISKGYVPCKRCNP